MKLADKPGSVVDSHSSSNLPADAASNVMSSLFGLAPYEVYPATCVATSAVSFCFAISPIIATFWKQAMIVIASNTARIAFS